MFFIRLLCAIKIWHIGDELLEGEEEQIAVIHDG